VIGQQRWIGRPVDQVAATSQLRRVVILGSAAGRAAPIATPDNLHSGSDASHRTSTSRAEHWARGCSSTGLSHSLTTDREQLGWLGLEQPVAPQPGQEVTGSASLFVTLSNPNWHVDQPDWVFERVVPQASDKLTVSSRKVTGPAVLSCQCSPAAMGKAAVSVPVVTIAPAHSS